MNTGEVDLTKLSEEGRKELLQYLRFREVYIYIFKKKFGYQEALFLPLKVGGYFLAGILKGKTAEEFMGG